MPYPLIPWSPEISVPPQHYSRSYDPMRRGFFDEKIGSTVELTPE